MNRTCNGGAILLLLLAAASARAQDEKDQAAEDERDLKLVHWKWVQDLKLPAPEKLAGPYLALTVPPAVFGKAQDDLRDLRLTDAQGKRVPYALRIMRSESQQMKLREARPPFNVGPSPKARAYEMSIELAEVPPPGHNEIEIFTTGRNYRRRVEVFGDNSDKFDDPRPFFDKKTYVVLYDVDNRTVDLHRFRYDFKQFRFVLVRVHADATVDEEIPKITNVMVRRSIIEPGEFVTEDADLGPYEATRGDGGPASAWTINLPDKMPCQKLTFAVAGTASERPFRLQIANPNEPRTDIAGAEWRWRTEGDRQLLEISFPEVIARRLRLVVTDFANEPLQFRNDGGLIKVKATRCVRKLIFARPDETKVTLPLKLYTGNTNVGAPNFDLAKKLPADLKPPPALTLAEWLDVMRPNPDYQPPPLTLNEQLPWLVYVVLGFACLVLLAILGALARQAIHRHDQKQAAAPPT
jgi:hypothetical protein